MKIIQKNYTGGNKISLNTIGEKKHTDNNKKWWKNPTIIAAIIMAVPTIIIGVPQLYNLSINNQPNNENMSTFNQNNIYGDNVMNFVSKLKQMELDTQMKIQLKEMVKSGSSVIISRIIGDSDARNLSFEIKSYLEEEGYRIEEVRDVGGFSKPIKGILIVRPQNDSNTYEIIIGEKVIPE